jgi:hypothetical protein
MTKIVIFTIDGHIVVFMIHLVHAFDKNDYTQYIVV